MLALWCLGGDWPQFRGARRDGVSAETGLARSWPDGGPALAWRKPIGDGFSSITVAAGRLYTMHSDAESEIAVCLKADTGEPIWRTPMGPKFIEEFGDGPRSTPIVDGDLVFVLSSHGKLSALKISDGSRVWEVDLVATFGGRVPQRGVGSTPLIDGDLLIVEGGGAEGKAIQALDKRTGRTSWTSQNGPAGYASGLTVTIDGVRQEIFLRTGTGEIVSLSSGGALLWSHRWIPGAIAMPLFVPPNRIFASASDDVGSILIEVTTEQGKGSAREVWTSRTMKNHFNSSVLVGDHIYGFDNASLKCISAASGEQRWVHRGFGKGSLIAADGLLIVLSDQGVLALAEASPEAYLEHGRLQALTGKTWTAPTLAGGRLYLRDQDEIVSLDLRPSGRASSGY
ncbi:MAG TPA: PQQ-binding-like beta-propeller repeat protein [Candidatus Polarisedimenticolia bacterium]|jgi:outer membrane protein assembly factor BamB